MTTIKDSDLNQSQMKYQGTSFLNLIENRPFTQALHTQQLINKQNQTLKQNTNLLRRKSWITAEDFDWTIFRNLPFWIRDPAKHEKLHKYRLRLQAENPDITVPMCCYVHTIGLPMKKGITHPIFDYELEILDALKFFYNILILKSRGLGITELLLEFTSYCALYDDSLVGSFVPIIVGPNKLLATIMINRLKGIFYRRLGIIFPKSKETSLILNGCNFLAMASNNPQAVRSLEQAFSVIVDEADFFVRKNVHSDIRDAVEGYTTKSNAFIFWVSTPNKPRLVMETMMKEALNTTQYKVFEFSYKKGLGKIYTEEEIAQAKLKPSFDREFNLQFTGGEGNLFDKEDIDHAVNILGTQYDPTDRAIYDNTWYARAGGIDWGSGMDSATGIVVYQERSGHYEVLHAEDHERWESSRVIAEVYRLMKKYRCSKWYCDSSRPDLIMELKNRIGEYYNPHDWKVLTNHKDTDSIDFYRMKIIPVHPRSLYETAIAHLRTLLERQLIAINPRFSKLVYALKSANGIENRLDKESTAYHDILDAFRQSLLNIRPGKSNF